MCIVDRVKKNVFVEVKFKIDNNITLVSLGCCKKWQSSLV